MDAPPSGWLVLPKRSDPETARSRSERARTLRLSAASRRTAVSSFADKRSGGVGYQRTEPLCAPLRHTSMRTRLLTGRYVVAGLMVCLLTACSTGAGGDVSKAKPSSTTHV